MGRGPGLLLLVAAAAVQAQPVSVEVGTPAAREVAQPGLGQRVRSIDVRGLPWVGTVPLPIEPCDVLTRENLSAAFDALRGATDTDASGNAGTARQVRIFRVTHRVDESPGRGNECGPGVPTVALVLLPLNVQVDLQQPGAGALPLPRGPLPAMGDLLPALQPLNPQVALARDSRAGTLLHLAAAWDDDGRVTAGLDLVKALGADFHRADLSLAARHRPGGPWLREVRLRAAAASRREALAASTQQADSTAAGGGVTLATGAFSRLWLDAERRVTREGSDAAPRQRVPEVSGRALFDALRPSANGPPGFTRAALWVDDGSGYRRWTARAGYARELRLSPGRLVGLDVSAGAGHLGGTPPPAARFFGGNSTTQFLFDGPGSAALLRSPRGPLLRAAGEGQATLAGGGGRAFRELSFNLALPVQRWSRPLIPDEETDIPGKDGQNVTLKRLMHVQVDKSGPSMMVESLKAQGMTPEAAAAETRTAFDAIRPAVNYIIDDAPLYAVRPLLMADVAQLSQGPGGESARWTALGLGVGVTMVSARIDAGWMHTVSGPTAGGRRGQFLLRMVFVNLF